MSADMTKPWIAATRAELAEIPATTGVYEIRRGDEVLDIDFAGALEPFGLQSKIAKVVAELGGVGLEFRFESHIQYRTRFEELVLVHKARHDGHIPAGVVSRNVHVPGRLSPG
jgi:hypothetical protein